MMSGSSWFLPDILQVNFIPLPTLDKWQTELLHLEIKNHDSDLILHTKKYKDDFHVPRKLGDEVRGETEIKSST